MAHDTDHTYLQVLDFIRQYQADNGLSPNYREIAEGVGLASTSTVGRHLAQLEKMGKIRRRAFVDRVISRQIEIIDKSEF